MTMGYLAACAGAGRWLSLREWLAWTSCSHAGSFVFIRNLYGDQIIEWGMKRSVWRCAKCGRLQGRDELHEQPNNP